MEYTHIVSNLSLSLCVCVYCHVRVVCVLVKLIGVVG
jgi:hypothetical protein